MILRAHAKRWLTLCAVSGFAACNTYDDSLLLATLGSAEPSDEAGAPNGGSGGSAGNAPTGRAGTPTSNGGSDFSAGAGPEAEAGSPPDVAGAPGTGGSGDSGGSSGSAGQGTSGALNIPTFESLDDFEDQDGFVQALHKRNGPWYVFSDATKTGTLSPFTIAALVGDNARPGSNFGLHLTASGFTDWGAGVGADLVNTAAKKVAYDVSAFSGVRFYARVASGKQASLKLLITTAYSDAQGGKCSDADPEKRCNDHLLCPVNAIKPTWDLYQCNFADLVQQGFGLEQPQLDPTSVYSVQFTQSTKLLSADLWLDDVAFVLK